MWGMRVLVSLLLCLACTAEVINVDHNASYITKLHTGVSQALVWMQEMIIPQELSREPTNVRLALVGLGRTGSTSFSAALKELGYSPVHDDEATEVADLYGAMMAGTMTMDEINVELGNRGFDAPMVSVHKYVEWAAKAPGVKVILTVRDKKKWAQSWLYVTPAAFLIEHRPFKWLKDLQDLQAFNREVMLNVPTNGHPELYEDIPTLEAGYDAWVDYVRKTVPKERLLEFSVKQGWGPLCEFLGEPIPSTPFPHINDRVVVDTIIKVMVLVTWIWPLFFATPLLLMLCCIRKCCGRRDETVDHAKKRA